MGSQTAYACDGPGCSALTVRAPGTQYPSAWPRVSYRAAGQAAVTGASGCAQKWLAAQTGETIPASGGVAKPS